MTQKNLKPPQRHEPKNLKKGEKNQETEAETKKQKMKVFKKIPKT